VPCLNHFKTLVGRPSQDTLTSGRLDWNIRTADRVFFRVQYNRGTDDSGEDSINSAFNSDHRISAWRAQMLETHTFGSSGASQFLAALSHSNERFGVKDLSRTLAVFPALLAPPFSGLGNPLVYEERLNRYQLSEDVVKTQGKIKLGFGASFERTPWTETDHYVGESGILAVQTLGALYEGGVGPNPDDFTVLTRDFLTEPSRHFSSNYFAVYEEANWHARSNLTLSLALRAEHYSNQYAGRPVSLGWPAHSLRFHTIRRSLTAMLFWLDRSMH